MKYLRMSDYLKKLIIFFAVCHIIFGVSGPVVYILLQVCTDLIKNYFMRAALTLVEVPDNDRLCEILISNYSKNGKEIVLGMYIVKGAAAEWVH